MDQYSSKRLWQELKTWSTVTYTQVNEFMRSRKGKMTGRILSYLLQGAIITYLAYELTLIGWGKFYRSLPATPFFYILFLVIYFASPFTEIFCYKKSWKIGFWDSIPAFIKKRVYNKAVMGYSGEIVVFGWARNREQGSEKEIFKVIRDNNIMSSLASTSVVFMLLLFFVASGQIALLNKLTLEYDVYTMAGTGAIVLLAMFTAFKLRRYYFSMPANIALTVFGFYAIKMVLVNIVQVLQWYVVMPEIALNVWLTFLSVQLLISRIPFLPSRDLFTIGVSMEVSTMVDISAVAVAGILVAHSVLYKVLNSVLFTVITVFEPKDQIESRQNLPSDLD